VYFPGGFPTCNVLNKCNTWYFGHTGICQSASTDGVLIGSAIFAGLAQHRQTDRHTDHRMCNIGRNRPNLRYTLMWPTVVLQSYNKAV